jgi:uncharacterized protein YndB with AHSA1/START domain
MKLRIRRSTAMNDDVIAAEAGMLIRRPVAEVFRAVVDPEVTTKFWFTRSSGKLEPGKRVRWEWEMYDQSADVDVDLIDENERIVMRWPAYGGDGQTTVAWAFAPKGDNTFITVTKTGFTGDHLTALDNSTSTDLARLEPTRLDRSARTALQTARRPRPRADVIQPADVGAVSGEHSVALRGGEQAAEVGLRPVIPLDALAAPLPHGGEE